MYRNYKITPLTNFSGGLVTKVKELNGMSPNASPDCMDVYSDIDGSLRKRNGVAKLNGVQIAGAPRCNGLFDFEGTLVSSMGSTYYRMQELNGAMYPLITGMKDDIIQCDDFMGNLIIANWSNDLVKVLSKSSYLAKYTKLLIHADGAQGSQNFSDVTGKVITNNNGVTVDQTYKKFGTGSAKFDGATNWLSSPYSTPTTSPGIDPYTVLMIHASDASFSDTIGNVVTNSSVTLDTSTAEFGAGSAYFNGSAYLSVPSTYTTSFGTGAWTIDFWINFSVTPTNGAFIGDFGNGSNYWFVNCDNSNLNIIFAASNAVTLNFKCPFTPTLNTWYHIAIERVAATDITTHYIFINGESQNLTLGGGAWTGSLTTNQSAFYIGYVPGIAPFTGWMQEVRVSNGVARWTANFNPPIAPYGQTTYQTTTDFDILANDYSIDMWVRFNALPTNGNKMVLASQYANVNSYWELSVLNTTGTYSIQFLYYNGSAKTVTVNSTGFVTGTFYHIAMCKLRTSFYFFQNGVQQGTTQTNSSSVIGVLGDAAIGATNGASFFNGWIDEIRFSQGIARWTANFTPPTAAYDLSSSIESIPVNLSLTSQAGIGSHPKVYASQLLMSGVPSYPYSFFYSQIGIYNVFDDDNAYSGSHGGIWPINTYDGDILMGWGELWGRCYAFKRWSIHQLTFRGGTPFWQVNQITWGVGTRSPLTIKNVTLPNGVQMLMFLGSDRRLYQFDGYTATAISKNIEESNDVSPISLASLNQTGLQYAHAVVDTINHWYVLFVANGGSDAITHALVYNYYTGSYNYMSASQFSGGAFWPFSNQGYRASCSALDPNGRRYIITGGYAGYLYRWNYGNVDDQTAISAYHTTPRLLMMKDAAAETPEVVVSMRVRSSDSINFQHREDYRMPWSSDFLMAQATPPAVGTEYYLGANSALGTMVLGAFKPVVEYPYGLDTMGEYIQFKVSDDGLTTDPWRVYAYSFKGVQVGQWKQEG